MGPALHRRRARAGWRLIVLPATALAIAGATATGAAAQARRRPASVPQPRSAATMGPQPPSVTLTLGDPRQVLRPDQFGMNVPDMHTAVVQGPAVCPRNSHRFCLYLTGVIGGARGLGSTALLTTTDFERATAYAAPSGVTQPIFRAPCRGARTPLSCRLRFDSGYRGANLVFEVGGSWVMIYHGETRTFTSGSGPGAQSKAFPHTPAYAEVGLARSADGIHWDTGVAIVSGYDPKPSLQQVSGLNGLYGTPEPGAIVATGGVYVFFPYIASPGSADANQGVTIEAARARLASLGTSGAGTWSKYTGGNSWTEPGLGGRGVAVVNTTGCTRPAQPWVGYTTGLRRYVMLVICQEGWFFSSATDLDREDWTPLTQVYTPQYHEFTNGKPTDDNFMLVSPGGSGATIGGSGDVLYAHDVAWGQHPARRSLWYRPFTISLGVPQRCPPPRPGQPNTCT